MSYQQPFVFTCFLGILFLSFYPKTKCKVKNLSDLCNFYNNVIFWNFYLRKCFMIINIAIISVILNKRNLLKTCLKFTCLKFTYPTDFCIICSLFTMGEKKYFFFFFFFFFFLNQSLGKTCVYMYVVKHVRQMVLH